MFQGIGSFEGVGGVVARSLDGVVSTQELPGGKIKSAMVAHK